MAYFDSDIENSADIAWKPVDIFISREEIKRILEEGKMFNFALIFAKEYEPDFENIGKPVARKTGFADGILESDTTLAQHISLHREITRRKSDVDFSRTEKDDGSTSSQKSESLSIGAKELREAFCRRHIDSQKHLLTYFIQHTGRKARLPEISCERRAWKSRIRKRRTHLFRPPFRTLHWYESHH